MMDQGPNRADEVQPFRKINPSGNFRPRAVNPPAIKPQ
jgi:hypothetical protein